MALVLVVDDERANLELFVRLFDDDFAIATAISAKEALAVLAKETVAVIVSDQRMPEMTGVDLLAEAAARWPDTRRILLTAYSDRELLLDAISRGHVHEYVLKPWDADDVRLRLAAGKAAWQRTQELARADRERIALRAEIEERTGGVALVGFEAALRSTIEKLSASDAPLVIRGETGTGKELVARVIHRRSARAGGPFVRASCRTASLFGPGGRLEQAEGGTLFLASIGDLPLDAQASLLAALDDGPRARIIAGASESLEDKTKSGAFRQDLYFRLNVVPLALPPLRERAGDIALLARHFVGAIGEGLGKELVLSADALESLAAYDWPGNVRELRNVIERACILAEAVTLEREDLLFDFVAPASAVGKAPTFFEEISAEEAQRVRDALKEAAGNRARAARILGVPRTTLNDRIKRLGIA